MFAGTYNARDVGGIRLKNGGVIASGVLIRSDALHGLTEPGREQLVASGVRQIFDLRTTEERITAEDHLPLHPHITSVHLPLLQGSMAKMVADAAAAAITHGHGKLGERATAALADIPPLSQMYEAMLRGGASSFAQISRGVINTAANGQASLIHCTAGKDRTGVSTALLLAAAGAQDEDIIADYAKTEANLADGWSEKQFAMLEHLHIPLSPALKTMVAGSPADQMAKTLTFIESEYGGASGYLSKAGLSSNELDQLTNALTKSV